MNQKIQALLSWVFFALTLSANALANILPINGLNTGQVSALYPNLFVPDGRTFAIWSIIYAWLLAYVVFDTILCFSAKAKPSNLAMTSKIRRLFWLTCLCNAAWILAWHYLQVGLSLLIMLVLLAALLAIFLQTMNPNSQASNAAYGLLVIPFTIYLAWICVATIANTTALLVHFGWSGWGIAESNWAIIMIAVATLLAVLMVWRFKQIAFPLVVAWALWGIYRGQPVDIAQAAMAGIVLLLVAALVSTAKRGKKVAG